MKNTPSSLIAPCGMNCTLCLAYQREKNKCKGCRNQKERNANCIIKNCDTIKNNKSGLCYECDKFPCTRLKNLDKRYRAKYNMSMIENLEYIKENGLEEFIKKENIKWECTKCNGLRCVHRGYCLNCQEE